MATAGAGAGAGAAAVWGTDTGAAASFETQEPGIRGFQHNGAISEYVNSGLSCVAEVISVR